MGDKKPRGDMQARILAYIESEIKTRGYAPSVREIGEAVGLKSTSTVHGHLTRLEKKGFLHRDALKPRAMGLSLPSPVSTYDVSAMRQIPVVGRVAAGIFALRVRGESMIQAGIMNDDYIIVRKQPDANNGEIVVAMIDDEATVKRFYKEHGYIRLQPENDAMIPIIVPSVTILGKVVSLIRRF